MADDPLDLLTVDEASRMTRMSRRTLLNRRSLGTAPPGFRVGRKVLFRRADVLRWLAEQEAADAVAARRRPA